MARNIFKALTRRKTEADGSTSEMERCLNLIDLIGLSVGSTLGLGVYVLAGSVAKTVAGPAVCLSFLVAAVAAGASALCYAEFASKVPKAGSAYVYSYVTVGEFAAFVIGWNLIMEYIIGTASVAKGLSNYIDALVDNRIMTVFRDFAPMDINFLSEYLDFLAFAFVISFTVLLSFGIKESSLLNTIFTVLNLLTVCLVLVSGFIKASTENWNIPSSKVPDGFGTGGFFPYGISGVMAGAARCFYGFVGFDAVATTGEEAKNPQRNLPLAIMISLFIAFFTYFGVSTVLTMMLPYYEQNADAPFPYVFDKVGWHVIKWIVTSGAALALCTSMLGALFPVPRIIYAMAQDGIIFKPLAKVNSFTKTPLIATILAGLLAGCMAMVFDLNQLIDMMSIGTLMAYTIVAISVIILRYQVEEDKPQLQQNESFKHSTVCNGFVEIFNLNNNKEANTRTSRITNWSIIIYGIFAALLSAIIVNAPRLIFTEPFYCVGFVVSLGAVLILLAVIARQPKIDIQLSFKVPLVPLIPCLCVFFNLYLMLELDVHTWIRFIVWLVVGLLIYFFYGIRNSEEGKKLSKSNKSQSLDPEKSTMRKEDTKL